MFYRVLSCIIMFYRVLSCFMCFTWELRRYWFNFMSIVSEFRQSEARQCIVRHDLTVLSCFIMFYRVLSCFIVYYMFYRVLSCIIMLCVGIGSISCPSCLNSSNLRHGLNGLSCFIMFYNVLSCFIVYYLI